MKRSFVLVHSDGPLVREGRAVFDESELGALGLAPATARPLRAPGLDAHALLLSGELPVGFTAGSLRILLGSLSPEEGSAVVRAVQVASFLDTHRHCGRCATALEDVDGELARRCPRCTLVVYPRLSPAVIVLVRRGDQALLARSSRFPIPFFSTLAGFVEIGETLEETVAREILEEVGVEVEDVRYFGSQPWPFPHSLMIGFTARWKRGEPRPDEAEIAEARFFDAHELPRVPPPISIARQLIDAWVREVTGGPDT
ncbi:MAG: NAD(+) diphosphatase [Sandaracinus sp.]